MNYRWMSAFAVAAVIALPAAARPDGPACCRGMHSGPDNTAGWSMMSPQERKEHRAKMDGFKSSEECKAHMAEHHERMAQRAKERGMKMHEPRHAMCEPMKRSPGKP